MDRDFNPKDGEWFYFMHQYADALMKQKLSGSEFQALFCIIRNAWSWKKPYADLEWKKFIEYTALSDGTLSKAVKKLQKRNMIKVTFLQESERAKRYRINSKISTWKPLSYRQPLSYRKANAFQQESTPIKKELKNSLLRENAKHILSVINALSGKNFQPKDSSLDPIVACLNRGHTLEQCLYVVENKWLDPDLSEKYYRPTTLFRKSLFEGYLNEKGHNPKPTKSQAKARAIVAKYERKYAHGANNPRSEDRSNVDDDGTIL